MVTAMVTMEDDDVDDNGNDGRQRRRVLHSMFLFYNLRTRMVGDKSDSILLHAISTH